MASPIHIFEVGPRDGLQNEGRVVSTAHKAEFISDLFKAGLRDIEIGAFVRSDRVPQMADMEKLIAKLRMPPAMRAKAWGLVPNRRGLQRAQACGIRNIALFTASSETFNQHNIGMSIRESLEEISEVVKSARADRKVRIRAYVSTAFGCPFEGKMSPRKVLRVIDALADLGVDQVSIGDTIGVATPNQIDDVVKPALKLLGQAGVAVHFHDTRGLALANTLRSLDVGVTTVDSSAGGLGGCPFAPGASGNLATEDLVYMLNGLGARTGVKLDRLCEASLKLAKRMKRPLSSRYLQSYASRKNPGRH
ncbi:MAG: hydroxymethylglutaryl-CoA lyase [Oligoflexia bacterium]|nr:hydroxymethylglutaryl-CoA lyase [Oligoflexia bacterium]